MGLSFSRESGSGPSSPVISNVVMHDFDAKWSESCRPKKISYTRYADDIYFSTNERGVLDGVLSDHANGL
jgi:hypothetical protein